MAVVRDWDKTPGVGYRVTTKPLSSNDPAYREQCRHATMPRSFAKDYIGVFSLGSLVFECRDIPTIWMELAHSVDTCNIDNILALNKKVVERKGRRCLHSLYSLILGQFSEKNYACNVSQAKLVELFQMKFESLNEVLIDQAYKDCVIENWLDVFNSLQNISLALKHEGMEPNVSDLTEIIKQISRHPLWLQSMMEETIALRCGPIRDITTRVNVENINYFMNQIKLSTSTDLLYRLFTSPSVMGKCAALYSLLEIHGQIWKTFNFAGLEAAIPMFYSVITWICEKASRFGQSVSDGFQWVKARFRRAPGEEDTFKNVGLDLPDLPIPGEKIVEPQDASEVVVSDFNNWFEKNFNPVVVAESLASYNNNCLFEAVHKHLTYVDPKKLREDVHAAIIKDLNEKEFLLEKCGFDNESAEGELRIACRNLDEGEMLGTEILPYLNRQLNIPFSMITEIDGKTVCYVDDTFDVNKKFYFLKNLNNHWIPAEEPKEYITVGLIGQQLDVVFKKPNVLPTYEEVKEEKVVIESPVTEAESEKFVVELESTEMGRSFIDWLKTMVQDVYNFFRTNPIIGGAMAFVFSIMSGIGIAVGKFTNKLDKRSFWEKVSTCSKDFYYLSRGQDAVAKVFGDFGQIFRAMIGVDDNPEVSSFKQRLCDLAERAEEINRICSSNPSEISNDPQRICEFINNMKGIQQQYRDLIRFDPTVNLVTLNPLWIRLNTAYQQTLSHYNKLCNNNDFRQRPVCAWLYGETNIGKTEIEQEAVYQLNNKRGVIWKAYTVSKGPEYLNGFSQENIIIIDDFDCFCSVEGCLDALLVMNMVSTAAFNPNIAAMEDKLLQAKPKLIIIMSNFPTARLNCGINYFMAFERRRDFLVWVTWPGHENCSAATRDCVHWKEVFDYMKTHGKKKFDHLRFRLVNPLVISREGYKGSTMPVPKNHKCPAMNSEDVELMEEVTLEQLIDKISDRIDEYQLSYEITRKRMDSLRDEILQRQKQRVVTPQADVPSTHREVKDWDQVPNISFVGPPGVGKSFLMSNIEELSKDVIYIKTIESFDTAAVKDWNYEDKSVVLFDDFTTFKDSPNIKKFWRIWKERYDMKDPSIALWVLGINEDVAIDYFTTLEEYDVHLRRSRKIAFSFNKKPGISAYLWTTFYTSQDLVNKPDTVNHSEYVQIYDSASKVKLTFDSLATELSKLKPTNKGRVFQYDLPTIHRADVDALAKVNLTADEFMKIVNARDDSHSALQILTGSKFVSKKFNKLEVGKRILKSFGALTRVHGTFFPDLDSLVIAGVNNNFFDYFKDGTFVLQFVDRSYILLPSQGSVIAAYYEPIDFAADIKQTTTTIAESVSAVDFLAVSYSTLPNWFIMTVSIAEQVLKILAAGAVISYNIKSQISANRALRLQYQIEQNTTNYLEESVDKVVSHHLEALNGPIPMTIPETDKRSKVDEKQRPRRINRIRSKQPRKVKGQMGALEVNPAVESIDEYALGYVEELSKRPNSDAVFAQLATDMAFFDVMKSCVHNMVSIQTVSGNHIVHGLMLYGHFGTTVAHAFRVHGEKDVVVKDIQGRTYTLRVVCKQEDEDRCDFQLTNCKNQFPDIRKHLCQPTSPTFSQKLGCLVNVSHDIIRNMPCVQMRFYRIRSNQVVKLEQLYHVSAWSYQGGISGFSTEMPPQTKKGDCGAVMFLCDSSHVHKIIGMHIASSNTEGFFRQLRSVDYNIVTSPESGFGYGPLGEFVEPYYEKDIEGFPVLAKCFEAPHLPTKTQLYRSPYAYGVCKFEPSVMDPNDPRMPNVEHMINSEAKKWLLESPEFSDLQIKSIKERMFEIGDWLGQKINSYGLETSFLNKTTALNASKGYTHSQPIPLGTSPGFPFMKICENGKRELIVALPDGSRRFQKGRIVQDLHNCIDQIHRDVRAGRQSDVAFTVFGKDELLKPGKNTRTIAAAPIALVIALRQYFHTIYSALAEVWNVIPIKVGISPTSLDWHNLSCYLLNVCDHGFAIDQKGFDFKIPKVVVESVVEALIAISLCTNPKCDADYIEAMRNIHKNVSWFHLIIKGLVYQSKIGVASGHPGTAIENSIVSLFLMYDAFCELAPNWIVISFESFTGLVALAIYGDDVSCTVSREIQDWYNQVTVMEFLISKYKLNITNADKTDVVRPIYPLSEMSFISRGFKMFEGYCVGPLNMDRLMKPLNFCHGTRSHHWYLERDKITDDVEIASEAARSALEEMFFHGRDQYDKLRAHLIRISSKLGDFKSFFPLWQQTYNNFFDIAVDSDAGLSVATVPISHSVVSKLQAEKGWVHYANRSTLNFGEPYFWDTKSKRLSTRKIPLYLYEILDKVNRVLGTSFNEILANIYKPGGEIPYHKDDEDNVDLNEGVACVTVIGDGVIEWIDPGGKSVQKLGLQPGFLYHMKGKYVTDYQHSRHTHEKFTFSLTFRKIVSSQ